MIYKKVNQRKILEIQSNLKAYHTDQTNKQQRQHKNQFQILIPIHIKVKPIKIQITIYKKIFNNKVKAVKGPHSEN